MKFLSKAVKWGGGLVLIVAVVGVIVAGLGFVYLKRSIPAADGVAQIAELGGAVEVVRDKEGVPHISAANLIDLVATQGYVHAQERLWQMEGMRMAGQGRLSEMYGEPTVSSDKFLRTLNFTAHAKASYERLEPETREVLQAYARGVNAYLERPRGMFEPALPPEFLILGHSPDPWEPWQSLLTPMILSLTLGDNMDEEIQRLTLASKGYTSAEIEQLMPYDATDNPPALPDLRELYGFGNGGKVTVSSINAKEKALPQSQEEFAWPIGVTASNNWVVSGSRTKSGKVLLANDPHLGLTAPSIWYLVHLNYKQDGENKNLVGVSVPSIPLIMLGRNNKIAWGFTTSRLDSQDTYLERLNPENPEQYLSAQGWKNFTVRDEIIKVSGGEDITYRIRSTGNGPLLPEKFRRLKEVLPDGHGLSLKWMAMNDEDTTLDALVKTIQSDNVDGFFEATRRWVSPMQSVVVGDSEGNIGFIAPSRMLKRKAENTINGRAPGLGWEPKYQWDGYLGFDDLYKVKNPENGVIYSANAKFVDAAYPHHINYDWAKPYRRERVKTLIADRNETHDVDSMKSAQADAYSIGLVKLRDAIFQQLDDGERFDRDMLAELRAWDGVMRKNSSSALIMMSWFRHLQDQIFKDDLAEAYELFNKGDVDMVLTALTRGGTRAWCDDRNTAKSESCKQIIDSSLTTALAELTQLQGSNWQNWRWGAAHIAYGEHRPFARVGALAKYFNVEVESGGGPYTVQRGQTNFSKKNPYYSRHASSLRAIYDFADLDQSLFIHTTGQSGHFLSDDYRRFAQRWADVDYIKIDTNRAKYSINAQGTWRFERK